MQYISWEHTTYYRRPRKPDFDAKGCFCVIIMFFLLCCAAGSCSHTKPVHVHNHYR